MRSTRFQILTGGPEAARASSSTLFQELSAKGYSRARVGRRPHPAEPTRQARQQFKHTIEVVFDRS
jgi:excinuclease ABC subunit A